VLQGVVCNSLSYPACVQDGDGSGFGYGDGDSPHYPASCRRQLFLFYRLPGRTLHLVDELLSSWSWSSSWSFCSFSSFCATMPSVFGFHLSADCQLINGSARFPWCFMQLRIYIAYTPCGDDGWMESPKIGRGFYPPECSCHNCSNNEL